MTRVWFVVCGLIIWLVAWAFTPAAPAPQLAPDDDSVFEAFESLAASERRLERKTASYVLEKPWGGRCSGESRQVFVGGLGYYYRHRQDQIERYTRRFGKTGADYIARQWSTTEDQRIDRLTQDAYARGYLKLADFGGAAARMIATVVRDERMTGNACAN